MSRTTLFRRWSSLAPFAVFLLFTGAPISVEASCLPASVKSTLAEIRAKFGPIEIASTHRPGARIAGTGRRSYHASCRAVDFNPPRGKYQEVANWLKANHKGGVGTYGCGMHHIHIDNGPRVRFHKCQGGSRYASGSSRRKYAMRGYSKSKRYAAKGKPRRYASSYKSGRRYASAHKSRRYASGKKSRRYASGYRSRRYASNGRRGYAAKAYGRGLSGSRYASRSRYYY